MLLLVNCIYKFVGLVVLMVRVVIGRLVGFLIVLLIINCVWVVWDFKGCVVGGGLLVLLILEFSISLFWLLFFGVGLYFFFVIKLELLIIIWKIFYVYVMFVLFKGYVKYKFVMIKGIFGFISFLLYWG